MEEKITLEWTFTPDNFFEEPVELKGERCTFSINAGKISAEVSAVEEKVFGSINEELNGLFLGAQLVENKPYTLSDFRTIRTHPDGTADIGLSVGDTLSMSESFDAVFRDIQGNIKHDSRVERIRNRQELAALAAKHRADPVAASVLKSYRAAADEPHIELIRLYEIRDALPKKIQR